MIKTARILVLEDDALLRVNLIRVLQDEGFDVMAVARGEEAVEVFSRKLFDLVVLDIHTGSISSCKAAFAKLKDHLKETAVLFFTQTASEEDSIRALHSGTADYLRKPFEPHIFSQHVNRLLKQIVHHKKRHRESLCLQTLHSWSIQTLLASFLERHLCETIVQTARRAGILAKALAQQTNLEAPIVQEIEIGAVLRALSAENNQSNLIKSLELWEDSFLKNYSKPEFSLARRIIDSAILASSQPNALDRQSLSISACNNWQPTSPVSIVPRLDIKLLGQCFICLDGRPIDKKLWTTQKAKYLFLRLLSHGTYLSYDQIIEEFWPNSHNGQACLWKALSSIKKIFKDSYPNFSPIVRSSSALAANPHLKISSDWQNLEKLWTQYRTTRATALLNHIKRLSQGHFLPQCSMEWASLKRVRLDYISMQALLELAIEQHQQQNWPELAETTSQAISLDPLHEQCAHLLMQAYLAMQQPQLAVKTFENLQTTFRTQLNLTPNHKLYETYQKARQASFP